MQRLGSGALLRGEIRDPDRSLPRGMIAVLTTVLYLLINLRPLSLSELGQSIRCEHSDPETDRVFLEVALGSLGSSGLLLVASCGRKKKKHGAIPARTS